MRALEFVTEALDQPYPFSFKETEYGDVDASTLLPDGTYLNISFNLVENDDGEQTVLVRFDRGGSEEITGAGDAQRVFATVLSAIQEYITDYQPLRINFLATKKVEPKQKSASRFKLYDRMIQRYARAWGYRFFRVDNGEAVIYEFSRINKGVAEAKKKKKKKSPRAMGGYFFPGYGYYGGGEGEGDGGGVAEGDKMSSINLDQSLANTPPVWKKFISSLPPQLAREFVDERPVPNQEDIDWFTPLRLTNPQPVAVSVADLLRHPENQGSIGRSPDDVIDTVNQQWGLKIPSGKKYDPNPARYRAYAHMTPGTASPSVAVDGVIIFGAGRFVAAALRGDKTMRVWNMTRKQGVAEGKLIESAVFLNPTTVIVGQAHGQPLELSPNTLKQIQAIAAKHGAYYEGNGTDRAYTKGQIDRYVGSWDDEVAKTASPNDPKWLYVLFANVDANNRVQRVGVDPKDTIFNQLLATAKDNSFQGIGYTSQALQKFLQMSSEGKYDFVKMSQQPATQENLTRFLKAGEALMWPSNWEQYPNKAGKIAKAATVDVRDQYLATRKAGVYVTGSGHLKAVQNITGKQGVAEVLNKTTAQLGPQLYAPHPKNLDESMKPRNALWTSTASGDNNGYTSAWVQWAESEMPQWIGQSGFLYDVSPSARILTINSDQDALIVAKKYGLNTTNVMDLFMYMPWNKIAKDYDAIHHVPSNRGADLFMHAWDVESTAWFNTNMLLNKRKVPIATSKTDLTEGKLSVDVPNEDWLQEKIDYARSKGRNSYGVPHFGSTTASIRGTPLKARVMRLASLPGMRNEQMNVRKDDLKWLMDYMDTHKKLPPMGSRSNEEYLPYIMVAYNGEAWVNEGNHRIMAAYRLNWQTMPIEINYFDGGERIESGPMYPGKIGLE